MALAVLALVPGVAAAQEDSPTAVGGVVIEAPTTVPTTAAPVVAGVVVQRQTLPRTGADLVPTIGIAVALMALGVLLVVSVRRRRTNDVSLA